MDAHTDKNYMMRWVGINPSTHIGVNNMDENKVWTDEDIGEEVEITIEGIRYFDTVIEMWLPDGQRIIGPQLKCGHIFARFTMLPAMLAASENTKKMRDMG